MSATPPMGAHWRASGTSFRVRSPRAQELGLCLFDATTGAETIVAMARGHDSDWLADVPARPGQAYGLRASGNWRPNAGEWFDPAKLLVDPYAVELDRRFLQDPRLATFGADTAAIVPRALVPAPAPDAPRAAPQFRPGGLIYELNVRSFTKRHPDIPPHQRGTVVALGHPAIIAHLQRLHVSAVELMPIIAWIDERHLPRLGLTNAWGYNPVVPMALDPGLCPGGVAELRAAVAALHRAGIGVILDIVLNHTGESDTAGGVLALRGLDDAAYARAPDGALINDTGCGNTLDFANPAVRALALASLRHFVRAAGVDGFRFDLAAVLARGPGFDADAPFFAECAADPWLADRIMIAEPWDVGPGGYRLGQFPANWLEWNDRFRDDTRAFWRRGGPPVAAGALATRLAGSADIFGEQTCRSVNFLAAHDGFTLADTVAYSRRHNMANGEGGRDGHGGEICWNNGAEGPSDDPTIAAARAADQRALLGTLFASTGTIMLTAGDEFGRSQQGNNNAYCQDGPDTWLDWAGRDGALEADVAAMAAWRAQRSLAQFPLGGAWTQTTGGVMRAEEWEDPAAPGFAYRAGAYGFALDRAARQVRFG